MTQSSHTPPLRIIDANGTFNQIPVFELEFSGGTITQIDGKRVRIRVDSGGAGGGAATDSEFLTYAANAGLSAERVMAASDNITIVSSGTSFLISANTQAAGAATVLFAPTGGEYLTYAANNTLSAERIIAASDNITIVSTGTSFLISANTGAGGGGGTSIVSFPMALLTVEVDSGNAFWEAKSGGSNLDRAFVTFADSGRSEVTYWTTMPRNLNSTPAWNLDVYSDPAVTGNSGSIVLNVDGISVAAGESANGTGTALVAAGSFTLNTSNILTISTMASSNFDGTLATSATDYMKIRFTRIGSADTFSADWNVMSVNVKCTVDT